MIRDSVLTGKVVNSTLTSALGPQHRHMPSRAPELTGPVGVESVRPRQHFGPLAGPGTAALAALPAAEFPILSQTRLIRQVLCPHATSLHQTNRHADVRIWPDQCWTRR